jgi:hypothetical protein
MAVDVPADRVGSTISNITDANFVPETEGDPPQPLQSHFIRPLRMQAPASVFSLWLLAAPRRRLPVNVAVAHCAIPEGSPGHGVGWLSGWGADPRCSPAVFRRRYGFHRGRGVLRV